MVSSVKKSLLIVIALFVVGSSFFAGVFVGIKNESENRPPQPLPAGVGQGKPGAVDFSIFWDTWNTINKKYVTLDGPTDTDKIYGAISGLVASLDDPYSVFLPPKESEYFESEIQGSFEGVGIEIGIRDDILTVIAPLKDTPAEKSGIQSGDKIIKIDETITSGLTVDDSVGIIRGKGGTVVAFTVVRDGVAEPFEIKVVRGVIDIPTINTKSRPDGVFVIELYSFSSTSPYLFRNALREFVESGDSKLILDLRNNPGGFMEASIDMASWFLPAGKVVVREASRDDGTEEKVYRSKGYNIFNDNLKFVILINQGSASASEILAGALSEQGKATLVGKKSFGKGSVQELVPITDDTSLKITVARWLTPDGVSISKEGLTPDVEVDFTKEDLDAGRDPQVEKAAEILNGM